VQQDSGENSIMHKVTPNTIRIFPGREADHSPPSSAEVKECVELYIQPPIRLHGVVLS